MAGGIGNGSSQGPVKGRWNWLMTSAWLQLMLPYILKSGGPLAVLYEDR